VALEKTYMKVILAVILIVIIIGAYYGGYKIGYGEGHKKGYIAGFKDALRGVPPPWSYIIIGTTDEPTTLDPALAYDFPSCNLIQNLFDGLMGYEPGTGKLVPRLAERYEVSSDGKVYTFYLRKGVKFHDGTELTAEVVKYSIERAIALKGDPSFLLTEVAGIESVEVVDKYTVRFHLKAPNVVFLSVMAFTVAYPVSPKAYPKDKFSDAGVGTGPYKLVRWTRGVEMVLEKNENYWDSKNVAKTNTVILRFYKKAETLRLAIEKKEVDIAFRELRPTDYIDLEKKEAELGLKVYWGPGAFIRYIVFNVKVPPFDNKLVRQAIACAVDRKAIADTVFLGLLEPLYSMVPKGMWSHIDAFKEKWGERNLDKARELLRKAGYSEEKPLEIELWAETGLHYGMTEPDFAKMLKDQLEETGMIKVTLKMVEWATYVDNIRKGVMGMFLLGWYPDYLDPDDYLSPFVESKCSPYLSCFYSSPEMDEYLHEALKTIDVEARTELYIKAQKLLAEDVPILPLLQGRQVCVALNNVKGIVLDMTQIFRFYLLYKE